MLDVQTNELTWRDLDECFPKLDRRELHDGVLLVSPSPAVRHQRAVTRLCRVLTEWTDRHGGEVLVGPVDVVAAEQRVYQPDLLLLRAEHLEWFASEKVHEPPDLVIEVSSPSNRWFASGPSGTPTPRSVCLSIGSSTSTLARCWCTSLSAGATQRLLLSTTAGR